MFAAPPPTSRPTPTRRRICPAQPRTQPPLRGPGFLVPRIACLNVWGGGLQRPPGRASSPTRSRPRGRLKYAGKLQPPPVSGTPLSVLSPLGTLTDTQGETDARTQKDTSRFHGGATRRKPQGPSRAPPHPPCWGHGVASCLEPSGTHPPTPPPIAQGVPPGPEGGDRLATISPQREDAEEGGICSLRFFCQKKVTGGRKGPR